MNPKPHTENLRIARLREVANPETICAEFPITDHSAETVSKQRSEIHSLLNDEDDRLLVILGPCSIHDPVAALEYGERLKPFARQFSESLVVIMRVYFEKPRTTVGWKGLINDPDLDGSFNIGKGLRVARKLLLDLNHMGLPAGTEYLDILTPQYNADLISWGAIGARTTESQLHRELASGLSCPVGFKNGTDGNLQIAIDAIHAASQPHSFLSLTKSGHSAIYETCGNEDCHIILRGGGNSPNYDSASIQQASERLQKAGLQQKVMVDFSHANSSKQYERQLEVGSDVAAQISDGDHRLMGVMIESHLKAGRQDEDRPEALVYGQSITDACISFDQTIPLLEKLAEAVARRRQI
jgi:3-deoxy-7-phosphoheptulonate synthase|tara:strand:+ start:466 stop:1530 length:1065 start_codon:yes stop_codon:yes gene_type:complete